MQDIYRLRYKVYCEEEGFLDPRDYPSGEESDEFDPAAIHVAVYGDDVEPMGYARVVTDPPAGEFPFQKFGAETFGGYTYPERDKMAEVSRLIIADRYRHPARNEPDMFTSPGLMPSRRPPRRPGGNSALALLKLFRSSYQVADEQGIEWLFAAVESRCARLLNRNYLPFRQVGPNADYYGIIQPYAMNLREMEREMSREAPDLWKFFDDRSEDAHTRVTRPSQAYKSKGLAA
jgi:N-acyl amino acid synthase of PEP-CTERM/exosortase system